MSSKKLNITVPYTQVFDWINNYVQIKSKKDLAGAIGVSQQAISDFIKSGVPLARLVKFSQENSASLDRLILGGQAMTDHSVMHAGPPIFQESEKPTEKRFEFPARLTDKERGDLLNMIESYDGIGRILYGLLNRRFRDEPVAQERRRPLNSSA